MFNKDAKGASRPSQSGAPLPVGPKDIECEINPPLAPSIEYLFPVGNRKIGLFHTSGKVDDGPAPLAVVRQIHRISRDIWRSLESKGLFASLPHRLLLHRLRLQCVMVQIGRWIGQYHLKGRRLARLQHVQVAEIRLHA